MEKVEFVKIHNTTLDFLNEKDNGKLRTIGFWYFNFLKSNSDKLRLHLPYYSKEFKITAFNYVRAFTIIFNLVKNQKLSDFEGTCLFDIFNYSKDKRAEELTLEFQNQKDDLVLWQKDTLTKLDTFLPIFKKEEIIDYNKASVIKNTFKLFKSIRKSSIIDFPIYIELKEKTLSFNNVGAQDESLISENLFPLNQKLSRKEAIEVKKELPRDYENSISIKYPYSLKPIFPLTELGSKKFNLIFNNRFAYNNEVLENDLILLKDESSLKTNLNYEIVTTNHTKKLHDLFKSFKEQWVRLELNKFITPFPKYWLLFLNPSLTKEQWLIQFKKDFPAVAEKPIIRIIEQIIEEVIHLNWIHDIMSDSTKILFPELKSNRKKRLEFVFNNFKNHVQSLNSNVEFIESLDFGNFEHVIVLDSFNIIELVNKSQSIANKQINVIVPDFLYFGYQPWIKFHLFNYQYRPLLNDVRQKLDHNYDTNKDELEKIKTELISKIRSDLKNYRKKYIEDENIEDENINEEDLEQTNEEDLEQTNEEEIETFNNDIDDDDDDDDELVIINDNLAIPSNEEVLLRRDSLLYVKARALKIGDRIIRDSDISGLFQSNDFYDKLVDIPHDVFGYQKQLFAKKNIYKVLKNKGISYQHQNYFDRTYALEFIDEQKFRIPRRKKDWAIICEFLNINDSDKQLSFIAYYGRSKQNELKQMYKTIIQLLTENNWLGTIENPLILESVSEIVKQHNTIFKISDSSEITEVEVSESIISTIFSQLEFTEIKTIRNE
ncbi:hypothetical protein [Polaribacter aquimarinus]|uniref:Uncharacterized protein n=1 Tax=Polaribacter aquimarinus TaxID=2100726 RepID=A0A2U2JA59_9FLAO|nr:hypothetical protein [Polaribacter aquimarinus]PWG05217.1 hypothetical protein DIS07_08195 [Polaribacter aquimarinus]